MLYAQHTRAVICAGAITPVTVFSSCSFCFLLELCATVYVRPCIAVYDAWPIGLSMQICCK